MAIGNVTKQYVSSTAFLDQREILNKVLDVTNEQYNFLDVMEIMKRSVPTAVPTYRHFINEELYGQLKASSSGGTNASNVTTLSALTNGGANSVENVRVGDQVMDSDGNQALVTAVDRSANTITTADIDANWGVSNNEVFFVFSNAQGEGSDSPEALKYNLSSRQNQVQIFKNKYEITDIQKTSKVEVSYGGGEFYMYKGQHDALMRFRNDISFAMMFGQGTSTGTGASQIDSFAATTPALTDSAGRPVSTTNGLHNEIISHGVNLTSTALNADLTLTDFATFSQTFATERFEDEYLIFCGIEGKIQLDDMIKGLGSSGAMDGVRFMHGAKEFDFNVDRFSLYGRTYNVVYMPMLDHPQVTANTTFAKNIYFVPLGKQKVGHGGELVDRIRTRFMTGDGTDLKYREILTGGLAPTPTNDKSVLEINYSSVQGLEVLGADKFAVATVHTA